MLGRGVYCSRDIDKARKYGSVLFVLDVRVGKVKRLGSQHEIAQYGKAWHGMGYNCAWVPPGVNPSGQEENCVWNPSRLKIVGVQGLSGGHKHHRRPPNPGPAFVLGPAFLHGPPAFLHGPPAFSHSPAVVGVIDLFSNSSDSSDDGWWSD